MQFVRKIISLSILKIFTGLLPIGEKALISFWIESFKNVSEIQKAIIVTNDKFNEQFYKSKKWYNPQDFPLEIFNDGSTSNETRLGAVVDIKFALDKSENDDTLVIAGDTLFYPDFDLQKFIEEFKRLKKVKKEPLALIVDCPCPEDEVHKHGIIEINDDNQVTSFLEKPKATETKSRSQSPCFYLFDQKCQEIIGDFLEHTKNLPIEKRDATGNFLAYLIPKANVYAFDTNGRYDVGNLSSYKFCIENFNDM